MDSATNHRVTAQKDLLLLLKEGIKENPNIDPKVQEAILNSINKQDYLDIVARLSLTKKNDLNSLAEVMNYAEDTGKYGIPVSVFDDSKKSTDEKLRIFMLDLNKYLKGVSESCVSVWKSFKKIKDSLSQFKPKHEQETLELKVLMERISNFKSEIESGIYSVSKTAPLQKKESSPVKSQINTIDNSEIFSELQDLRKKVASLHDSTFKIADSRQEISRQEAENCILSLKKHLSEPASEIVETSPKKSYQSDEFKEQMIKLLVGLIQTRSLSEMKRIDRDFELLVGKRREYQHQKQILKFFIRDKQQQSQTPSPSFEKGSSKEVSKIKSLEAEIQELKVSNRKLELQINKQRFEPNIGTKEKTQSLKSEAEELKVQLSKRIENELKYERENKKLEIEIGELKKELEAQRHKFSQIDLSSISRVSQDASVINYSEIKNDTSPVQIYPATPTKVKETNEFPTPASENRTEIMMEVVQKYELLQKKLRQELDSFSQQNTILNSQVLELQGNLSGSLIEIDIYKNEIASLKAEQNKVTTNNKDQSQVEKEERKDQFVNNSWMQNFFIEQKNYQSQIQKLKAQIEQYKTMFEQFWIEQRQYKGYITQQNSKIYELEQTLTTFFIQENLYKNQIQKLRSQLKDEENKFKKESVSQNSSSIQAILSKERLVIRKQIQEESQQQLQAFWLNEEILKAKIKQLEEKSKLNPENQAALEQQIEALISNEEILKFQIKKLNETLKQKTVQSLPSEYKEMIQQFWIEEKRYKSQINQLNERIHDLEKSVQEFFIEQKLYQSQIQKYKTQNNKTKSSHSQDTYFIESFFIEEQLYKSQIQKIKAENYEYKGMIQQFWVEEKKYKNHITQLNGKIYQLQKTVQQFFIEETLYKSEIKKMRNQSKEDKKIDRKEEQAKSRLNSENQAALQQQIEALISNEEILKFQIKKLNEALKQKTTQSLPSEYKEMIEQFWIEEKKYKSHINQLNERIHDLEKSAQEFFIEQKVYQSEILKLNKKNKEKGSQDKSQSGQSFIQSFFIEEHLYKAEIQKLRAENHIYKTMIEQFWIEQKLYKAQIEKYLKKLQDKSDSSPLTESSNQKMLKAHLQKESVKIRYQIQEEFGSQLQVFFDNQQILKRQIKKLIEVLSVKEQTIKSLELSLRQQKSSPKHVPEDIIQQSKLLKKENKVLEKIQKSKGSLIQSLQTELQELKLEVSYFQQCSFFQADIFEDNQSQKSILIKLLTDQIGRNIFKTKLLYKYDNLNKASYHSYVDNHQSLLVMIQTKNTIIGGFYSGLFGEKALLDESGFLFSIHENQCYPCIAPGKAIIYDKLFYMMGNSDLRANLSSQEIFSNFGTPNSCYDSRGKKIGQFLREGEVKETKFIHFEVFTVEFEQISPEQKLEPEEYKEDEDSQLI